MSHEHVIVTQNQPVPDDVPAATPPSEREGAIRQVSWSLEESLGKY